MAERDPSPVATRGGTAEAHPGDSRGPTPEPTRRAGWLLILIGVVLLLLLLLFFAL